MNASVLDNPVWYALNSHHSRLALRGKIAARYPADVFIGAAMPEATRAGLDDLRSLVEPGEVVGLAGESLPQNLSGWQLVQFGRGLQMVCAQLEAVDGVDAVELTSQDVPEMLTLINLAQPGPFLPRTIEMGRYLGVHRDGKLVAMAGERLHVPGYCEISAVCTHPNYRRRGYAGALTSLVAQGILARHETPFLHVVPENQNAIRLYIKLGFQPRKQIGLTILQRVE